MRYNAVMEMQPSFVAVNGVRIAYHQVGEGYPLLLVHGFPRDRRLWRKVTPGLASRLTVVAMDRRGYGESDRPADPAVYDDATMARDALELMRSLGWERFLVGGHDLGAPVVQRLVAGHPEAIAGAVFLDSTPSGPPSERRDPSGRSWYMDFFRQRGVAEQIIGQNPRLFFSLFLARHPHLSKEEHEMFLEPLCRPGSVEAMLADYRHMLEDGRAAWESWYAGGGRLETPICALWGERGPSGSAPVLDLWRQVAGDVRGSVVAGAAHYLQEEQPDTVVRHILAFAGELGLG